MFDSIPGARAEGAVREHLRSEPQGRLQPVSIERVSIGRRVHRGVACAASVARRLHEEWPRRSQLCQAHS